MLGSHSFFFVAKLPRFKVKKKSGREGGAGEHKQQQKAPEMKEQIQKIN